MKTIAQYFVVFAAIVFSIASIMLGLKYAKLKNEYNVLLNDAVVVQQNAVVLSTGTTNVPLDELEKVKNMFIQKDLECKELKQQLNELELLGKNRAEDEVRSKLLAEKDMLLSTKSVKLKEKESILQKKEDELIKKEMDLRLYENKVKSIQ
ncbi:MAG: hypothetical protein WC955_09805 [Elusimicrobiota bacterium]